MMNDVKDLFIYLLPICMSLIEECLFMTFVHFKIGSFGFLLVSVLFVFAIELCEFLVYLRY